MNGILFILFPQQIQKKMTNCTKGLLIGLMGCMGGFLIHVVIGSLYQWGIISVYITSYYRSLDPQVTLEKNAIAYPIMMLCIGLTMKLGLFLSEKFNSIIVMGIAIFFQAGLILSCSFCHSMGLFIVLYGALFGLCSGVNFMVPIYECNKYFPNRKMYINGFILMGTGLGPLIFGLFSYNFLNPHRLKTIKGYYIGTQQLEAIALKVPQYLRWLALIYFLLGVCGLAMISFICLQNRKNTQKDQTQCKAQQNKMEAQVDKQLRQQSNAGSQVIENSALFLNQKGKKCQMDVLPQQQNQLQKGNTNAPIEQQIENPIKQDEVVPQLSLDQQIQYPQSLKQAICTKVWWIQAAIIFFGSCGLFLMNGNYKTYVKGVINDDYFLTIIGVVGSVANGTSRFLWNLLINYTGYKLAVMINFCLQIAIYGAMKFSVQNGFGYLFLIFMINICIGGILGTTPTFLQLVFGVKVGSLAYGFFWEVLGISNLIQFAFVSGLASKISFNNVIYICLGMTIFAMILLFFANFRAPWGNSMEYLGYFKCCSTNKIQVSLVEQNKNNQQNNSQSLQKQDEIKLKPRTIQIIERPTSEKEVGRAKEQSSKK